MVVVHDTPSECALQCMKSLRNISYSFQVIKRTRFCDRQTDRQTDRRKWKNNMSPILQGGDMITAFN